MASNGDSSDPVLKSLDETKVEYRQLGKSGLRVSVPILGSMSFGDKRWAPWVEEEEKALPLLKYAFDKGLNTWDTANMYSNGESERIIAKAIKKYNIPRHKLVILTKCNFYVGETPDSSTLKHLSKIGQSKEYVNHGGLSRTAIFSQVEGSLARLGMDYVDMLQIHRFDKTTPPEETMEALHDLIKSGKVRYIGASSMWAHEFAILQFTAEKHGWTKFISMQNQYNLLYREEEREMNKFCDKTGVGLIPWAPVAAGKLCRPVDKHGSTTRSGSQPELEEADQAVIKRVQELAEKKGWKMSQVAIAWIKHYVTSPIIGFSSEQRIDEAVECRGKELTDEECKHLEEPYKPKPISGHG